MLTTAGVLRQVGRNQLVQHQSAGNHAVVHKGGFTPEFAGVFIYRWRNCQ